MVACGITDVDAYLNPDSIEYQSPDMYKNIDVAVDMFRGDVGRIGIIIDSDMDGACSAAIAYMAMTKIKPLLKNRAK